MDRLGDFLTSLRNAYLVGHREVDLPYASLEARLAEAFQKHGYLAAVRRKAVKEGPRDRLEIDLKYIGDLPAVAELRRLSKPGRRVYTSVTKLPKVQGFGNVFISTSKGILIDTEARKRRLGGELICEVYRGAVE